MPVSTKTLWFFWIEWNQEQKAEQRAQCPSSAIPGSLVLDPSRRALPSLRRQHCWSQTQNAQGGENEDSRLNQNPARSGNHQAITLSVHAWLVSHAPPGRLKPAEPLDPLFEKTPCNICHTNRQGFQFLAASSNTIFGKSAGAIR